MRREASVSRLAAALLAALGIAPLATQAATIVVTTTGDAVADPGCTLRNAIVSMNTGTTVGNCANTGANFGTNDTINFDAVAFPNSGPNTITLTSGQLSISTSNLTIDATANGNVTIDANGASRVMYDNAANGSSLTLNHLTISNGKATTKCAGFTQGGGICVHYADLVVSDSTFGGNSALYGNPVVFGGFGGAIVADLGKATLTRCTLTGNSAISGGAIIANQNVVALIDSTLSGNTATQKGGAIYAPNGGVALTNSTVYGNSASSGGAIYGGVVFSPVTLEQTTVAGNTASVSGGGLIVQASSGVVMNNSVFAANKVGTSDENITGPSGGTTIAGNNNLVYSGGLVNTTFTNTPLTGNPNLGPLADNGGPTQTMALGTQGAAFHLAAACASTDQRGLARPANHCDAGAFEDTVFFDSFDGN